MTHHDPLAIVLAGSFCLRQSFGQLVLELTCGLALLLIQSGEPALSLSLEPVGPGPAFSDPLGEIIEEVQRASQVERPIHNHS
jgi:hypothetical protein